MKNCDFKTDVGQEKATEIAKNIFCDFEEIDTGFTDYGTMNITVDDIFEFKFTTVDDLLQAKRIITLLELKKLERPMKYRKNWHDKRL